MYCIYCGQQLPTEANFCWKCGKAVIQSVRQAAMSSDPAAQLLGAIQQPRRTTFNLMLVDCGPKKIEVIKVIRQLTNLGLVEAKNLAESPGSVILQDVSLEVAENARRQLEAAGAYMRVE